MKKTCLFDKSELENDLSEKCEKKVQRLDRKWNKKHEFALEEQESKLILKAKGDQRSSYTTSKLKCKKEKDAVKSSVIEICLKETQALKDSWKKEHQGQVKEHTDRLQQQTQSLAEDLKASWKE